MMAEADRDRNHPLVSIIIPNFNGGRLAVECVASILRTDYPNFELLFADNASTDATLAEIESLFGKDRRLRIITLERNYAFTGAINIAFKYARGELIVFMNNDTIADHEWLSELVKAFLSKPDNGAAQAKLLRMDDPSRLQYGGGTINTLGFVMRGRGFDRDEREFDSAYRIFFASGACMLTSKKILKEVGLPDVKFLMFDDADLGWRMRLRGYEVIFVPSARVLHRGSATLAGKELDEKRIYQGYFENLAMLIKNYSLSLVFKTVVQVLLLRSLRILSFVLNGQLKLARAAISGILRVLKELKSLWQDHLFIKNNIRKVPDRKIIDLMRNLQVEEMLFGEIFFGRRRLMSIWSRNARLLIRLG